MYAALFVAALIAWAIGYWAPTIGERLGLVDRPDAARKLHSRPTPLVGGLMVILPTLLYVAWVSSVGVRNPALYYLLFAALVLYVLGIADDRRHVDARVRLLIEAGTVLMVALAAPGFVLGKVTLATNIAPLSLGPLSLVVSVFAVVGLINATNMADGVDGLAAGLMLIWVVLLMNYSPPGVMPLLQALLAGLAVAWWFNMRGKLFMGDSGVYWISALLGLLSIHAYNRNPALTADMVLLWFLLPVVDCLRLVIHRMLAARSPFAADRNHLHHLLVEAFGQKAAVAVYLSAVGGLSLGSSLFPGYTLWFIAVGLVGYAWVMVRGRAFARKASA